MGYFLIFCVNYTIRKDCQKVYQKGYFVHGMIERISIILFIATKQERPDDQNLSPDDIDFCARDRAFIVTGHRRGKRTGGGQASAA